ncbi:MAG: CBS domain-containing protein [Fibrobacterota bacterium]
MLVKEIMRTDIITVPPEMPVKKLIRLLMEKRISGAPVVNENKELVGIVSGIDVMKAAEYLIKVFVSLSEDAEHHGDSNWVEGIMTKNVITVSEETDIREAFRIMVEKHIHRLPVTESGKLKGIITSTDACRLFVEG